ncbi:energy-coupling factor transporter ATPase [Sedimentibacter sp.]|uniref:energy-coupling factor transporter ATPase n=1 Tax=Sedimentibacter sp. TaxID=1960295 RepID=UPI0028AE75D9|nr:energy-coupling factor transporter ATPase [Sedimentibacter sp.]
MSIKAENIKYVYSEGTPFRTVALDDISIEVKEGDFLGIIGHTGSGKSTLIQLFNGLEKPTEGKIIVDGITVGEDKKLLSKVRQTVGLVFQYPEYQLFEETVAKDVAFGPMNLKLPQDEIDKRVKESLELVGFNYNKIKDASPFDLSGGQKRRVAIAGVLAMKPSYLVLDEPTAGLDPAGRNDLFEKIKILHEKANVTVILVSHSMEDIAKLVNRVIVLYKGKIHMEGIPKEIYSQAEELRKIGLGVPQVAEIVNELRKKGFNIKSDILTVEEAKEEILKEVRKRNV